MCKYYRFYFFFSLLIIVKTTITAQSINNTYITDIQYFSTTEGLSHREVKCIFQDRDGMIWIGTQNGLNRFDGYTFKQWLDKNYGVDLRNIRNIGQDDEGWLWLDANGNNVAEIVFFHPETKQFKTIEERFGTESPLSNFIRYESFNDFPIDKKGCIYINNYVSNIMYRYHSSEGFTKLKFPMKIYTNNVVIGEKEDELYYIHDIKADGTLRDGYQENPVDIFEVDKVEGKEIQYKLKEGKYNTLHLKTENQSYKWKITPDERLQLYTKNDTYLLELEKEAIKYPIQNLLFDQQNRLWIGTDFGFYMVTIQKNRFEFITAPDDNFSLRKPSARGMFVDKKQLLACFEDELGLASYDFATQKWTSLQRMYYGRTIYPVREGKLWIGKGDHVLLWNNQIKESHNLERYRNGEDAGFGPWCFIPSQLNKNWLWIGTDNGLLKLYLSPVDGDQLVDLKSLFKAHLDIKHIITDKKQPNHLLFCTKEGLWIFNETTEKVVEKYNWNQTGKYYLPTDNVHHIYQENENIYWLATANGVIRWDRENNAFRQITIEDGLPNNVIYAIYPGDFGNLWMSSDYGIIRMNTETFAIQNFLPKDGTGQTEFNRISHYEYRDEQGNQRLFFGGLDGITTFYPKDFQEEEEEEEEEEAQILPTLALLKYQQFSGSEQIVMDKTLTIKEKRQIIIRPNDYIYELEVGLLNYENVASNQYFYQLNSDDWKAQRKRIIQLGQLPYGTHQLKIKAKTINNTPAANILEYTIIVKRPFYLTWWFFVLTLIAIITAFYFWYLNRTNTLRTQQKKLEEEVQKRTEKIEIQAEELKNLDKVKSRFFANISHELRTPLTLITAPVQEILAQEKLEEQKTRFNLGLINKNSRRLQQMVNEILDLSKLESGKMELNPKPINWHQFIRQTFANFESLAEMKRIDYQLKYENKYKDNQEKTEGFLVKIDRNKVETAFNNLLSNAFKFTPNNGQITINAGMTEKYLWFHLQDTGRGVSSEDLPHIFKRYYQTKNKNQAAEGGTGIGLALTKELVQLHNGNIEAASELGKGTTFKIQLPLEIVDKRALLPKEENLALVMTENTISIDNEENAVTNNKQNATILLVEDNPDLSAFIKSVLEEYYNVITAANGQEALERLTEKKELPSLIVSDVMMPIMDGFQLLERLKSTPKYQQIPVVMLTARASLKDKLKALRIGVDDYLTKPFIKEELLVRIENLLQNAQGRKEALELNLPQNVETTPQNDTVKDAETKQWLDDLEQAVLKNIELSEFTADSLAAELYISNRQLYRKTKELIGVTPLQYVKTYKLNYVRELLENKKINSVKAAAYSIGYPNPIYFRREFKKAFGRPPSDFLS